MLTEDRFQQDRPPIFLSDCRDETGQPDTARGWDVAAISSRSPQGEYFGRRDDGDRHRRPVGRKSGRARGERDGLAGSTNRRFRSKPNRRRQQFNQSPAAQDSAAGDDDAPAREEIAAAVQPVERASKSRDRRSGTTGREQPAPDRGQSRPDPSPSPGQAGPLMTEELFKQFQAWAAEEETRTQAVSAQTAPVRVAQDAPAPAPAQAKPAKRHRRVHSVQNARAEIRPQRHYRARIRQEQEVQAQAPPAVDPRAPDPSLQNAQPPSFLQSLGFRNQ